MGKNKEKNKVILDWTKKTIWETHSAWRCFIVSFISFDFGCFEDILAIFVGRGLREHFWISPAVEKNYFFIWNPKKGIGKCFHFLTSVSFPFLSLSLNPLLIISLPLTFNSASSIPICFPRSCKLLLSDFWHWPAASIISSEFSNLTFPYTTAHISTTLFFPSPQL